MATTTTSDGELRDARRGQIMGAAWLAHWIRDGRGTEKGSGSWIRRTIAPREPEIYAWIWREPSLSTDQDLDEYRGQQAGAALLAAFGAQPRTEARFWFDAARKEADTEEAWLFAEASLKTDGWQEAQVNDDQGTTATVWTKKHVP